MADSETQQPVDISQQVTSQTPAARQKNPKQVASGKAIAEKMGQAREAQKKAMADAELIIAKTQLKNKLKLRRLLVKQKLKAKAPKTF